MQKRLKRIVHLLFWHKNPNIPWAISMKSRMETARSTPSNAWWRVYQKDREKVAELIPNIHHNSHNSWARCVLPATPIFFSGYNLISFWGEQKKKTAFRFEKQRVRWMYEGFRSCNKKHQMAEEWLHAPVHFWAPPVNSSPRISDYPHVLGRRGLAQALGAHSSPSAVPYIL